MESARANCYWCISWQRQIAGLCTRIFRNFGGSVWYCDGKRERKDTKDRVEVRFDPLVAIFFPSNRNTLNNRSKIFHLSQKWRRPFMKVHCIHLTRFHVFELRNLTFPRLWQSTFLLILRTRAQLIFLLEELYNAKLKCGSLSLLEYSWKKGVLENLFLIMSVSNIFVLVAGKMSFHLHRYLYELIVLFLVIFFSFTAENSLG